MTVNKGDNPRTRRIINGNKLVGVLAWIDTDPSDENAQVLIAASFVSKKDQPNRKLGREIALGRIERAWDEITKHPVFNVKHCGLISKGELIKIHELLNECGTWQDPVKLIKTKLNF